MSDPEGYRFLPHDQERCQCEGCQRHRATVPVAGRVAAGSEKGWCLDCNEWGDPDPVRAHPASECPWRPVPPGGEEMRERLARILCDADAQNGAATWDEADEQGRDDYRHMADAAAAALAEARAAAEAPYDRLTAEVRALAEELESAARAEGAATDIHYALTLAAARLRGLVTDNSEESNR